MRAAVRPSKKNEAVNNNQDVALLAPGLKMKGDAIAGRYRVEKLLGVGSAGFVVAARHVYLRRRVTLKLLTSPNVQQKAQRRRLALAQQAAALRSPYIARVVDTGFSEDGIPFIATERLDGCTIAAELSTRTFSADEAVHCIIQACEGLAEAHAAGIVHGDLKPQNLFLAGDVEAGAPRVLKILDFGMTAAAATAAIGDETGSGEGEASHAWFASPAYLAPEQINDPIHVDGRADVWALGVILYQMIAGELPFASDTISGMLVAVAYDEPALLTAPDVPYELARVVHRCLAKDPSARISDVASLARELAPFAGTYDLSQAPPPMTMTMDSQNGVVSIASRTDSNPPPLTPPVYEEVESPLLVARRHVGEQPEDEDIRKMKRDRAMDRRRKGAIATVAAAALVAFVSIFEEPPKSVPAKVLRDLDPPLIPGDLSAPGVDATNPDHVVAMDLLEPRAFVPPSFEHAIREADASALPMAWPPPAAKPRAALAVRENPYARGFTHPSRLLERRR